MKTSLIIFLQLLILSQALFVKKQVPSSKGFEALKKDKSWSKIVLTLAELHMMSDHPIDQLIDAVSQLVEDLQQKQEGHEALFFDKTKEYRAEVGRLQSEIDSAVTDVFSATNDLDNNLNPRKESLEHGISQKQERVSENNSRLEKLHQTRESEHAAFEERQQEHTDAISALDEALNLLQQLLTGNFIQTKFARSNLEKTSSRLVKHLHDALAKALVALATNEFSDQKLLREVIDKLSNIRENVKKSQLEESQFEQALKEEYESEVSRLEQNNTDLQAEIASDKQSLEATNYSITQQENFRAQRQSDLNAFQAELDHTNEVYEGEKKNYEELSAQFISELNAANEALKLLQNGEFTEYIRSRLGF